MSKISEKIYRDNQIRKIQFELRRLDQMRDEIKKKHESIRTFEEIKFLEGVDETMRKLEYELMSL